ncbi:MAG TPA: divergent polysaccharide deacetylase family protein [Phenylobacterium sp.]
MFSKKPAYTPAPEPQPRHSSAQTARALIANPLFGVAGAAMLFLTTLVVLIAVTGDPKAGEPVVRISLAKIAGAAPPNWRSALAPERPGEALVTEDLFQLSSTPVGAEQLVGGQAVITLPGGQTIHAGGPLAQAPLAGFYAPGPGGFLPVIAPDGRTPAQAYARPFAGNGKPRIAVMIGGLGLNAKATREAIEQLPPQVTLSFVPYADGLQGWIDLARAHGHEVLLEAPMEPLDYPDNDPGPYTLLAESQPADTVRKLEWLLSRASGYYGLTNYLGSRFVTSDPAMATFAGALKSRGLAFIDDGSAAKRAGGIPRASADRLIDEQLSTEAIDQQLLALEAGAVEHGQALGAGFAYPVTLSQVARWASGLEQRGYQLAPASALTSY